MSRTLNKVQLIGRLGGAVELRYTGTGTPVATFSIATNTPTKNQDGTVGENTDWHNIVVWDKLAETCNEYLQKGSQIYIEGRIQYRTYENREGQKVYKTEVIASQMIMLDSKPNTEGANGSREAAPARSNGNGRHARADEPELEAEELPF